MNSEQRTNIKQPMVMKTKNIYSLIPFDDFKAILGVDDREDKIARFCLVSSTFTIEQYCKRRLLRKRHFEKIGFTGDMFLPLREYPVVSMNREQVTVNNGAAIDPKFYRVFPDFGADLDIPFFIELSPAIYRVRGLKYINVRYTAGYRAGKAPVDLASACLELAAWNMNRYRGRRIGMTGSVRGSGKDGEHFEMFMPENVRAYRVCCYAPDNRNSSTAALPGYGVGGASCFCFRNSQCVSVSSKPFAA